MRCFLAAWPTDDTRAAVYRLIVVLKDRVPHARAMQARNLHLTLAFIGDLEDAHARALAISCADLADVTCDWTIDRIGSFPRARVAWAGGPVDEPLADCVARARRRLDELGIAYDHRPFVPHVTLFRDVRRVEGAGALEAPLRWETDHVALYAAARDRNGPIYRRVAAGNG